MKNSGLSPWWGTRERASEGRDPSSVRDGTWPSGGCRLKIAVVLVSRWENTGDLGKSRFTGLRVGGRCHVQEAKERRDEVRDQE